MATDDSPVAANPRRRQALRLGRRAARRPTLRCGRRGACADGRQRRRQEHAGQDHHRRASRPTPARSSLDGAARALPLARRGAPGRHRLGLPGSGARAGSDASPRTCASRASPLRRRARPRCAELGIDRHRSRRRRSATCHLADPAPDRPGPRARLRPEHPAARRDHRRAAGRPGRAGLRDGARAGATAATRSSSSRTAWPRSRPCATARRCCATASRSA